MLRRRVFDVEDSNILEILTAQVEEKLKLASEAKAAFAGVGKDAGVTVWRVEKNTVAPWPKDQNGVFYSGNDYLVLRSHKTDKGLVHDIHVWVGHDSAQDDYAAALVRMSELDEALGGTAVLHREVERHESAQFLSYFKVTHFHEGAFDPAHPKKERKNRLLHLKGTKNVISRQVPLHVKSLNSGDVFILDAGQDIYQFNGTESGAMERAKGVELVKAIAAEHAGAVVNVHTVAEGDDAPAFWKFFGGKQDIAAATPDTPLATEKKLFRLSDETGKMQMIELKPVSRKALDSKDAFVLDGGHEIFVWVGSNASKEERARAIAYASDYLFKAGKDRSLPISRVVENYETDAFLAAINPA